MPRPKKKYMPKYATPEPTAPAPVQVLPFAFQLKDAAEYTGFSISSLRSAAKNGDLHFVKPKPYTFLRDDLEAWVRKQRQIAA